jgi:hypothetical protein
MDMQAYLVIGFQSWRLLEANSKHWIDYFSGVGSYKLFLAPKYS